MTLVQLVDPAAADPVAMPALESGRAQYGTVLNTWRALLHRPSIFAAYLPYLRAVVGPGVVDQRVKELASLAVTLANHCRYSASHRVRAARNAGVTDEELDRLAGGRTAELGAREALAIEYARELTLRPPELAAADVPAGVDEALLARVREAFSEPEIVELTATICLWNALTRFHRVMGLPLDMPAPPPAIEAAL